MFEVVDYSRETPVPVETEVEGFFTPKAHHGRRRRAFGTLATMTIVLVWIAVAWTTILIGIAAWEMRDQEVVEAALAEPPAGEPQP